MEHEGDTSCKWCIWNNPQSFGKGTGRIENKRASGDNPDNRIVASVKYLFFFLAKKCIHVHVCYSLANCYC